MDKTKSDAIIEEWIAKPSQLKRANFQVGRRFNTNVRELFALLCPTTEYDWLPGWKCELLHSYSGHAELNCIFKTRFFESDEIWVCTRYEWNAAVDYTRYSDNMCAKMAIAVIDHHDGTATANWDITFSALNQAGDQAVDQAMEANQLGMQKVLDVIEHYVDNGQMMA